MSPPAHPWPDRAVVSIELGNAAFAEDWQAELARILRKAADEVEQGQEVTSLRDANGNKVGSLRVHVYNGGSR